MSERLRYPGVALLVGFLSGVYSALVISLGAGRVGRSIAVDWMQAGTLLFGNGLITMEPNWGALAAGVVTYLLATLLWAGLFFALLGWLGLRPAAGGLLAGAVLWAVLVAGAEYCFILPWVEPWIPMRVPFWGLLVTRLFAALVYPLFPVFLAGRGGAGARRRPFVVAWTLVLALPLAVVVALGVWEGEPGYRLSPEEAQADRRFLVRMSAHNRMGLDLARSAERNLEAGRLQDFAQLLAAERDTEIERIAAWWRSGASGPVPDISRETRSAMVGMPPPAQVGFMEQMLGPTLERLFLTMQIRHHEGAVVLCNAVLKDYYNPRTALLALAIRHARLEEQEAMRQMLRRRFGAATVPYEW